MLVALGESQTRVALRFSSDFALKRDPNYGNCYTFNADGKHMTSSQAGMKKGNPSSYRSLSRMIVLVSLSLGLSVAYFVSEQEYLDFIQNAGVRVVVHRQNETVFPDASGFNIPSGYQSTISLTEVVTIEADPLEGHSEYGWF